MRGGLTAVPRWSIYALAVAIPAFSWPPQTKGEVQVVGERSLYYRTPTGRFLIKELKSRQHFQGTATIGEAEIFLAYSTLGGEAGTVLSAYDVKQKKEHVFLEIGDTGDSSFSYNSSNGLVVFNWYSGIYVFPLASLRSIPDDRGAQKAFEKVLTLLVKCDGCFDPTWSGDRKVAYQQYEGSGTVARYVDLPGAISGRSK